MRGGRGEDGGWWKGKKARGRRVSGQTVAIDAFNGTPARTQQQPPKATTKAHTRATGVLTLEAFFTAFFAGAAACRVGRKGVGKGMGEAQTRLGWTERADRVEHLPSPRKCAHLRGTYSGGSGGCGGLGLLLGGHFKIEVNLTTES